MAAHRLVSWLVPGAVALVAPLLIGARDGALGFDDRVLAAHNRERAAMGVPPLQWRARLAHDAQAWADRLAATGAFEHSPDRLSDPEGENLWAGTRNAYSVEAMVDGWVREKRYYKPGVFPNNSTSGRVADVGHYTQLIWSDTREVGCATASSAREDILVCRYSQAGNYRGERPID